MNKYQRKGAGDIPIGVRAKATQEHEERRAVLPTKWGEEAKTRGGEAEETEAGQEAVSLQGRRLLVDLGTPAFTCMGARGDAPLSSSTVF